MLGWLIHATYGQAYFSFSSTSNCGHSWLWCTTSQHAVHASISHRGAPSRLRSRGNLARDGKGKGNSDFEISVKNLPFEMDEKTLHTDFLECGEIDRVPMPVVAGTQKTMGFAWITFKNAEGLKKALEFNDEEYGGRRLFIEKSGQHRAGDDKGKGEGKDKCKGKN